MSSDRRASLRALHAQHGGGQPNAARGDMGQRGSTYAPLRRAALIGFALQRRLALQQMRQQVVGSQGTHRIAPKRCKVQLVCVPYDCRFQGPMSLQQCAHWADRYLSQAVGADASAIADLASNIDWVLTSCFSGTGAAEVAGHAIVKSINHLIASLPEPSRASLHPRVSCSRVCDQACHTHIASSHCRSRDMHPRGHVEMASLIAGCGFAAATSASIALQTACQVLHSWPMPLAPTC